MNHMLGVRCRVSRAGRPLVFTFPEQGRRQRTAGNLVVSDDPKRKPEFVRSVPSWHRDAHGNSLSKTRQQASLSAIRLCRFWIAAYPEDQTVLRLNADTMKSGTYELQRAPDAGLRETVLQIQ